MNALSKLWRMVWVRRVIYLLVILALAWLVKLYFFPSKSNNTYITAPVTRTDLEQTVLATGTVKAFKQVEVGAQVSGQIQTLKVQLGQAVRKGDLLAIIDARTQKNTLQTAQAQLTSNQANLEKAQLDFTRQQTMFTAGASSKENLDAAKATLAAARAAVNQSKISVDNAKLTLGYTQVLAPIDGVVVSLAVEEGQTVNANQSTPTLLTIAQLDKVTIRAEISEGDVTKVKIGMPAYFTILGDTEQRYETTLRAIDPGPTTLTDNTSSSSSSSSSAIYYYGMLDVPNDDGKLRIAMTTQVSIVADAAQNALTIPSTALGKKNNEGKYLVKVLGKDNKTEERWVEVGLNNNVNAEVKSGLNEGEQVVVSQSSSSSGNASASKSSTRMPPRMGL
ncbi:MAG: macA 2 [Burkholderiaceae bacterium]|nr:macA 2 [Burkholderiaceae bacterium]